MRLGLDGRVYRLLKEGVKVGANCIDHVLARNNGGTDTFENLVTACRNCNSKKGNRAPLPMRYGRFRGV